MSILVTGGAGFIGSHIAAELIKRGYNVTVLDDLSGGFKDNLVEGITFVKGSITDPILVNDLFEKNHFEFVYHLAAYAAEGLSHFIKRFNYTNNLIGSVNLINASVNTGVKCFVFTSSIAVYGATPELPMTEETPTHPEDSYGIAKLGVEQELIVCKEMFDLDYIIFRPHNVYGERQNIGDKYRNVVGIFMNQILQGKPMTIFGDGTQTRAFSYIGDIAPILAESICFSILSLLSFNFSSSFRESNVNSGISRILDNSSCNVLSSTNIGNNFCLFSHKRTISCCSFNFASILSISDNSSLR